MSAGRILVTEHDGMNIIRLVGDVRLTLCISFDEFIKNMFEQHNLRSVIFDLRDAEGIDSTTLGLMAKISIGARDRSLANPVVMTSNASITRLLVSMGFEDIFELVSASDLPVKGDQALPEEVGDESKVKEKVLEAHRILMDMNQGNRMKFKELVETLQGGTGC